MTMQLVERDIKFSDDVKAIIRAKMATGRYVYEDEVVTAALYLLLQDMANKGEATETFRAVPNQPLDEILAVKFRSGDHAESLETPRSRHRGRRLLQRLIRPGQPQAATVKMTARPASAAFL
jgi:Arc/MetJ-type ribon-helix-helix transcriptional regulator